MPRKAVSIALSGACAAALLIGPAPVFAQPAAPVLGQAPACTPPAPPAQPAGPPPAFARDLPVTVIPGVVAAGVSWKKIWQQAGNSADGLIPDKDGNVLMAQEDYDTILRLDRNGKTSVAAFNAKGIGSLSVDRQGRLYGAHRTERAGSTKPDKDLIKNAISMMSTDGGTIGAPWTGNAASARPNDLVADNHGGAYFTAVCLYYASPQGVTTVAEDLNTNGIDLSPDDKTLYVTNGPNIVAFDVKAPGVLENRRNFGHLDAGGAGDGLAVDTEGRLYVSSGPGVQVFDRTGKYLGLIPTPRGVISITIAGPKRDTLFMAGSGADDENGQPIKVGPQQTAATVYSLPLLSRGLVGHAK